MEDSSSGQQQAPCVREPIGVMYHHAVELPDGHPTGARPGGRRQHGAEPSPNTPSP
jgi:hypothetical protein